MIIADRLRKTNRAEYLLYMWQVEDILRAHQLDIEELRHHYLSKFQLDDETRHRTEKWYEDLCNMMRADGVAERGHLQINKNALADLEEFHNRLLASQKFPYYREMYYKVLPYIVELRSKSPNASSETKKTEEPTELETCFNALYGAILLRLQHKEISKETNRALQDISTMLGQLSDYYLKDKTEPIDL